MSDRLQELLQQRASIQAHLAWLDREIAAAQPAAPATLPNPAVPSPTPGPMAALPEAGAAETPVIDGILASYRTDPQSMQTDIRRGCFLYFFGALALLGIFVAGVYFYSRGLREKSPAPVPSVEPAQHPR